jgi:hypothetical protein
MTSLVDAESVLAIDIGTLNTRALLFDVVDGQYHFIASASAPTTDSAPFYDIAEGVHISLERLQEITGRSLTGSGTRLVIPSQTDGSGIDRLALTCSAGRDMRVIAMGLLGEVSLQSAQRLAGTTYARVVETIGLNDRRKVETQLDAVLKARPDVIILAGGTEKGATRSVLKLVDLIVMACRVIPKPERPVVLYCGNGALAKRVKETLERETLVEVAPNIRPTIDQEDLSPAETYLSRIISRRQVQQIGGLEAYSGLASSPLLPSSFAFGRMMRFSSELSGLSKPTLGVDLGAGATTLVMASAGSVQTSLFRTLGIGTGLGETLKQVRMPDVTRWVPYDISDSDAADYLYQKSIYPSSLPLTPEMLSVEQAMARQILRTAAQRVMERWPGAEFSFERIFVCGAVLTQAASPVQSLMLILDGLQPVGINVVMLDPYSLSQAIGTIAGSNTLLPAQIIESGAYMNLGTVICPVCDARPGSLIMRVKITYEDNTDTHLEIKQGGLVPLPVRNGQVAHLEVDLIHGAVLDPSLPRLRRFKITGGACGAVIDARGRPIHLPDDPARRRELLQKWTRGVEERRPA